MRSRHGAGQWRASRGLAALACAQALAATAPTLPLTLSGPGPVYVLAVDAQARQLSATTTLGDLRVRDAAGQTMAFAWADAPPASTPQQVPAHLAKLPVDATGASARPAWIVDTHEAGDDLLRLDLALERDTQGAYTLRIEASDDLQHWRTLQEQAPLVQLQALPQVGAAGTLATLAERERPSADGIDLDGVPARYLRLTTAPRSAIPPLVSAAVTRAPHRPPPPPLEWSAPIAASRCEETSCDYPLPPNTPVAAVQVVPADIDTIGQVMVLGQVDTTRQPMPHHSLRGSLHALRLRATRAADKPGMAWDSAAIASVYWLSQASGAPDLHSPPVRLDGATWQALRLETFGPISQLGHAAPTIRIAVRQRRLVFVARGAAPFVLARATPADQGAPLSLAELMPGQGADPPLPAASASIAPPAAPDVAAPAASAPIVPATPAAASPWPWIALAAGVALVGAAAWSWRRRPRAATARDGA